MRLGDDRIVRASISSPAQGAARLVEERAADTEAALVLLLLSPHEMVEHALPAKDVQVVAEASESTLRARLQVLRYGYLLVMQPGSHLVVAPRWAGPGAIERRVTAGAGGVDLVARDLDSSTAVEMASIAA